MKSYKVVLEGWPITIDIDDERQRVRFVVTRFVEAGDPRAAREQAISMVRSDPKLRRSADAWEIEQMNVTVGRAEEIPTDEVPAIQPGFAFFPFEGMAH